MLLGSRHGSLGEFTFERNHWSNVTNGYGLRHRTSKEVSRSVLIAGISTLISRSIEHRSIYDAKLSDEQVAQRQKLREQESNEIRVSQ